jgi:hypothetical protein
MAVGVVVSVSSGDAGFTSAGLLDSYKAVQMAESIHTVTARRRGSAPGCSSRPAS